MSIFDNCTNKPVSKETELFVMVKYGEPQPTDGWFDSLPDTVVARAFEKIERATIFNRPRSLQKQTLSILLRQPANHAITRRALIDALIEYHMLLG